MFQILSKIPSYYLFRLIGLPRKLPMNLTLSVTYKCNSRCKTCNVYERNVEEFTFEEWQKVFKKIGKAPFWVTISGGEPFLRKDLPDIIKSLYDICRPSIINIPTNGLLNIKIPETVKEITEHCKKSQIVINVSIDDIDEKNDEIRGIKGSYEKAVSTFTSLKFLNIQNLSVGIHTVISKFNVKRIPEIYNHLKAMKPDSYITEIAEEREELNTIGSGITPEYDDYKNAVDFLLEKMKEDDFHKVGKITRAFRIEYYKMVKKVLVEKKQIIPCYSGFASAPDFSRWRCMDVLHQSPAYWQS